MNSGRILIVFLSVVTLFIPLSNSAKLSNAFPRSRSVLVHVKVDLSNVAAAQKSLKFPYIIQLLFGNSIIDFKRKNDGYYQLHHTKSSQSYILPMSSKPNLIPSVGLVFKQYSLGTYPVPMENSILFVRLVTRSSSARLYIWIVSSGIYTQKQLFKQRLFTRSLANEFADNARRALGVSGCSDIITVSGLCNHLNNTLSGTTMQELLIPMKITRPTSTSMEGMKPNVRDISNAIVKSTHDKKAPYNANMWFVIFGQLVDHEIVLTPNEHNDPDASTPIIETKSNVKMDFTRAGVLRYKYSSCCQSKYLTSDRVWSSFPFNRITSFVDGSAVYGSSHLRVNTLRAFHKGKIILQTVGGEKYMPFNNPSQLKFTLHNEPSDHDGTLFAAGDVRANENLFLTAMHTLLAREHNRVCDLLFKYLHSQKKLRLLRDSWMFTTVRQIVAAEMQSITFNEFVPLLLGSDALPKYQKYNPKIDARVSIFHSAFAFRWGHSGIAEKFYMRDRRNQVHFRKLKNVFFNTKEFLKFGMDNIIEAATNISSMDIDEQIVESLRDSLFKPPESKTLDLASLNLQRGRDVGLVSYLKVQEWYKTGKDLDNIPVDLQKKLLAVYKKKEYIDAFIGCLSETKKPGALLGPLCWKINQEQFINLRDGDRFYYENVEWHKDIRNWDLIKKITNHEYRMADLVRDNTNLKSKFKGGESLFKTTSLIDNTL